MDLRSLPIAPDLQRKFTSSISFLTLALFNGALHSLYIPSPPHKHKDLQLEVFNLIYTMHASMF